MNHPILSPGFRRADARGTFAEILNQGSWGSLILGEMKTDAVLGHHYHKNTEIYFFLKSGRARVTTQHAQSGARDQFGLAAGQGVLLPANESHAIRFLEPSEFVMLKSRRYDSADPDTFPLEVKE